MKCLALAFALAVTGTAMATPTQHQPRDARIAEALAGLKRDPTGQGFAHLGADGVVRAFDADLNVVDAVPLVPRTTTTAAAFRREPDDEVRARLREAQSGAAPPGGGGPQSRDDGAVAAAAAVLARQQEPKACNTIFCNSDEHCIGQKNYGYDCSNCFFISDTVGNCM